MQIRGIKLCLPHEDDVAYDPTMYPVIAYGIQHRKSLGKTTFMVITDFMTRLWQVCKPQITNKSGMNWRLIVTHPSGWETNKLEQAIDTAIVKPDHGNGTYTICFQTEAEAALMSVLDARRTGPPPASHHGSAGQGTQIQDGESVVVADFGGLTVVGIMSGHIFPADAAFGS